MTSAAWRLAFVAHGLAALAGAAASASAETPAEKTARVTFVSGSSVYLDAGRSEGLAVGRQLTLYRGTEIVGNLEVTGLSSHKAVCRLQSATSPALIGDTARFVPEAEAVAPAEPVTGATLRAERRTLRSRGIRGRVGIGYLSVADRAAGAAEFSRPSLDLRFDGTRIDGTPWGVNVDVRARRTLRTRADGSEDNDGSTRVYRAAVTRRGVDDPYSFTVGRQFSPALSAISLFDGVSAEYRRQRLSVGLLSGSQPDADGDLANDVREHGAYVRFDDGRVSKLRWAWTVGLIGSYEQSEINREFLYLQGRLQGPRVSTFFTQEVDYNRGWKRDAGENSVTATSTFIHLRYRAHERVSLYGGFDDRRSVRLYRNLVTPETDFDDSFRRGVWGGASVSLGSRFSVAVDTRLHREDLTGTASTYTGSFSAKQLTARNLDLRARVSRYDNQLLEGTLYSATAGARIGPRVRLQLGGGIRDERRFGGPRPDETLSWLSADAEIAMGNHWYVVLSTDRTTGDSEETVRYYASTTFRF